MIFETLLPHATVLTKNNQVGESCFVLQSCRFGMESFEESFEKNLAQAKPKTKLDLPILLIGRKVEKTIPGRFQGNKAGNVPNNTFGKKKKDDLPDGWFPWLSSEKNKMTYNDFLSLLQKFNDISPETVYELFKANGSLFTFEPAKKKKTDDVASILEKMVVNSTYQVVTCKKPALAVHSVLALNALNEKAELLDEDRDPCLIRKELFKFCLLFWMLKQIESLRITDEKSGKDIQVEPKITASGNIGDISSLPLLLDAGVFYMGAHTDQIVVSRPIVKKILSLIREDTVDTISLTRSNKVFTAPSTGKAPTNAYRKMDRKNVMAPEIMLGFDRREVNRFLPAYSNIIQDKAFSLSRTALTYYVFPEDVSLTGRYLEYLSGMISQLNGYKQDYFDCLGKNPASTQAKERRKTALSRIQEQRKALWEKSWSRFKLSELLFAFEENVGSSNQPQFAWTSVYHHLPAAKAFLFLEMVDDPAEFGRLATLLHHTSLNLSEGWKEKEVKRLVDRYFLSGRLDQIEYWIRWRKYLVRNDSSKNPIDARLWEHAMSLIIQIKAMSALKVDAKWTGKMLLSYLQKRRKAMDEENQLKIRDYLTGLFLPGMPEQMTDTAKKGTAQVLQFIERQARDYGIFVDTESDSWQAIIDGLVCGWALKQICRTIRKDDYKSVIGGKSLAKHTPAQLRTLSIDLYSKTERAGTSPWNVQAPLERMFNWSQKNPHTPEVVLFMDAVSLGFMRYDNPIEAETNDGKNDDKPQNGGSDQ
ncbi:MAG: hypothetical protein JRE28_16720 [Deltaproteobacteria bacterium]|nr:hypothetical protein [Deltaproteobacteria bacterium]